jgi:conjugal transfer mating pair stabilization protein TraG
MDFTMYTLGDLHVFQAAFNAIAMIFSTDNEDVSGLWVSNDNPLGLGYGPYLGMIVGLLIFMYNGVLSKKFDVKHFMLPFMLYVVLFVPKIDLQIEDVYSGQVAVVANVPAGIAIPATVISGIMYHTTKAFETVFATVDGNYISMSAEGFMTPLKVLNSLKSGQNQVANSFPFLTQSMQMFAIDCVNGRDGFNEADYKKSSAPVQYLLDAGGAVAGITMYYSDAKPQGEGVSCATAKSNLQTELDNIFIKKMTGNGVVNPKGLNAVEIFMNAGMGEGRGANGNEPYRFDNYEQAFTGLVKGGSTQAKDFVLLTLFSPHINGAMYCASQYATEADMARCMPFTAASEQWKEDAAAGGSFFSKVMIHGMNIMIFLFYALTPIMALVLVILGMQGVKAVGSFALFGMSTQMWLPVAAIVNYFIQLQVGNSVDSAGGSAFFLNVYNAPQFYDQLSTKVALAGDVLGSVPLICMGIFTGSMYATTQIAQRWGGRDYYNEKQNVPDPVLSEALASVSSFFKQEGFGQTQATGMPRMLSMGVGETLKNSHSESLASATGRSEKAEQGFVKAIGDAYAVGGMSRVENLFSSLKDTERGKQIMADLKNMEGSGARVTSDNTQGADRKRTEGDNSTSSTNVNESVAATKSWGAGLNLGGNSSTSAASQFPASGAAASGGSKPILGGASALSGARSLVGLVNARADLSGSETSNSTESTGFQETKGNEKSGSLSQKGALQENLGTDIQAGKSEAAQAAIKNRLSSGDLFGIAKTVTDSKNLKQEDSLNHSASQVVQYSEEAKEARTREAVLQTQGEFDANQLVTRIGNDASFRENFFKASAGVEQTANYDNWQQKVNQFETRGFSPEAKSLVARWMALRETAPEQAAHIAATYYDGVVDDAKLNTPLTTLGATSHQTIANSADVAWNLQGTGLSEQDLKQQGRHIQTIASGKVKSGGQAVELSYLQGTNEVNRTDINNKSQVPHQDRYYRDVSDTLTDFQHEKSHDPRATRLLDASAKANGWLNELKPDAVTADSLPSIERERKMQARHLAVELARYNISLPQDERRAFYKSELGVRMSEAVQNLDEKRFLSGEAAQKLMEDYNPNNQHIPKVPK